MVLNLMIGLLHPPMGMVLFVLARVAKMSVERTTVAILPWLIPLLGVWYALASMAPNPLAFFFLLIPAGLTVGSLEIIINLEADRTEHLLGRRIMNRAHAFWSIGFFGAGLVGGGLAQLGVPVWLHLLLWLPLAVILVLTLMRPFKALLIALQYKHRGHDFGERG